MDLRPQDYSKSETYHLHKFIATDDIIFICLITRIKIKSENNKNYGSAEVIGCSYRRKYETPHYLCF